MTFNELSEKYIKLKGKPDVITEWTEVGYKHVKWFWKWNDYLVEFACPKDRIDKWKVLRKGI